MVGISSKSANTFSLKPAPYFSSGTTRPENGIYALCWAFFRQGSKLCRHVISVSNWYLPAETATPRTPNSSGSGAHSSSSVSSSIRRMQLLVRVLAGRVKHPSLPGQGMLGVSSPLQGFSWHSNTCSPLPSSGREEEEERQQTFFSFLLHTESLNGSSMSV